MRKATIVFLGGGNMARALITGIMADHYPADKVWVIDRNAEKRQYFEQTHRLHTAESPEAAIALADIIVLAVKPQSMKALGQHIGKAVAKKKPLIISTAAGIRTEDLAQYFGNNTAIVRTMPNMPSLVQSGATGLFANDCTSSQQKNLAEHVMRSVGLTKWFSQEEALDSVCAISGCGPAYFLLVMEVMANIAETMGIDEKTAHLLVLQTAFGAAKMALENHEPFHVLRQQVASKGGATEAALNTLKENGIDQLFEQALHAAKQRSTEIAESFSKQFHTLIEQPKD